MIRPHGRDRLLCPPPCVNLAIPVVGQRPGGTKLIGNLISLFADKNVQLIEKLEVTTKKSVREKISCFLSIQAQKNKSRYFTLNMGRMELSEFLCVNRSALTRELNLMRSEGLIDFDRNTFKIIKIKKFKIDCVVL